jgi:glycine C-acetyltransferase
MTKQAEVMAMVRDGVQEYPSSSGILFGDYFAENSRWNFRKDGIIDARGRRVFETTALAVEHHSYPFQIPLEGSSGPWVQADGHRMMMLSSYDYLGLIGDRRINEAAKDAVDQYGTGTGGVRLLTGSTDLHQQMEADLAAFKGTDACITFSSGYLANIAVIASLFGPSDRVIADSLSHRSLIDACRLAGVQLQRFQHNDPISLRHELESVPSDGQRPNRTLIISDGVFSMDGDIACLPAIIALKKEYGCYLLMDEAHATGMLGPTGRGTDEHWGIDTRDVDIWTGSLAKAIPSNGGFVAVSQELAIYLQHAAAPFIFSAALCPAAVAAVRKTLEILEQEPERVTCLRRNADFMRSGLQALGYDTGYSQTGVIPVILGSEIDAGLLARRLRDYKIIATPVVFPAVAQGIARLRLCVTAAHTQADLEYALDAFEKLAQPA